MIRYIASDAIEVFLFAVASNIVPMLSFYPNYPNALFTTLRPAPRFGNNLARTYDEVDVVSYIYGRSKPDAHLVRIIRTLVPQNARVLEIGIGTGNHLVAMAKMGYDACGVDIDTTDRLLSQLAFRLQDNRHN